jgi:uncharacterized lipoprotein YbaY
MKSHLLKLLTALCALTMGAGCGHVDLTPEGSRSRVMSGTLNTGVALPAGAEVMVRIVAASGLPAGQTAPSDIPVVRQNASANEQILGEFVQKLPAPVTEPVVFRIEYDADDALLRRGLNLEARIYFDGRIRYRTVNAHVVTLTAAHFPQRIELQAVAP